MPIKNVKKRENHGMWYTREYKAWADAKSRCNSKLPRNILAYKNNGIKMFEEWSNSFLLFYKDMGKCPGGYTLERIDVSKGYSKDNCRWATWEDQARNKTNTIFVTHNGESNPLIYWIKLYNLVPRSIYDRYYKGIRPPDLFREANFFPKNTPKVTLINTQNGIFYNGYKEAHESSGLGCSLNAFSLMVSGFSKNKTPFIKLDD